MLAQRRVRRRPLNLKPSLRSRCSRIASPRFSSPYLRGTRAYVSLISSLATAAEPPAGLEYLIDLVNCDCGRPLHVFYQARGADFLIYVVNLRLLCPPGPHFPRYQNLKSLFWKALVEADVRWPPFIFRVVHRLGHKAAHLPLFSYVGRGILGEYGAIWNNNFPRRLRHTNATLISFAVDLDSIFTGSCGGIVTRLDRPARAFPGRLPPATGVCTGRWATGPQQQESHRQG